MTFIGAAISLVGYISMAVFIGRMFDYGDRWSVAGFVGSVAFCIAGASLLMEA